MNIICLGISRAGFPFSRARCIFILTSSFLLFAPACISWPPVGVPTEPILPPRHIFIFNSFFFVNTFEWHWNIISWKCWSCVTQGRNWIALTADKRYNKCHILEVKITYRKIILVSYISIIGFHASRFTLIWKDTMISKYQFSQRNFRSARNVVDENKFPHICSHS